MKFDEDGYTLCATEDYEEGDEVYMSYGGHPNDFLLAECETTTLGSGDSSANAISQMASSWKRTTMTAFTLTTSSSAI